MEEQRQAVSQASKNQEQRAIDTSQKHVKEQLATSQKHVEEQLQQVKDHVKEIVREKLRELGADRDRHSGIVAKSYPYDGKISWDVYYLQFEKIARMNDCSNEEKAFVLTSMHREAPEIWMLW
nr:unnamed protein product [Callosobruchus chinensis]